ncbi:cysteine--1-D-myo-inosityl 2-amino-2-deoxy-alpha-D-glucopyranoside ligase [Flaviflexus equikiangi]|uniref:tRNA synthetases class I catalytic domain-containing protein n=1 Tax=Flaviflexus equikiangi TaxID=2758573 RepID=A0ABS2TJ69_9ACTO|nr:cysteine--1-D-myo-inosityl 2-amino-2-deoxy-alpha-D-glucopyranoside ligase [Flaviflexus equikiangi]MBM9433334.1 hypothetical protein [Flaviflexus equikiangi]
MRSWPLPHLPALPGQAPALRVRDTRTGEFVTAPGPKAALYVCGITPYDATHLGHAFTYVAFDMLVRVWRDSGLLVEYAQNITDIDDPLFERAEQTDVDWRELADSQIELFRSDMETLRVIPPTDWVAVSDFLDPLETAVRDLIASGRAYGVTGDDGRTDYYHATSDADYASEHLAGIDLIKVFGENGGDPERPGKRHPLDPIVWKGVLGDDFRAEGAKPGVWRPGWHIECALISRDYLGTTIDIQGGGSDLVFPHQEMTSTHHHELDVTVRGQMNTGIVSYEGHKMSKSLGNLVLVSKLVQRGFEPMVVRLALLNHRWDSDWEYTDDELNLAERRVTRWRRTRHTGGAGASELLETVRRHLADNLDTPKALEAIDAWAEANEHADDREGALLFDDMCKTLLGLYL